MRSGPSHFLGYLLFIGGVYNPKQKALVNRGGLMKAREMRKLVEVLADGVVFQFCWSFRQNAPHLQRKCPADSERKGTWVKHQVFQQVLTDARTRFWGEGIPRLLPFPAPPPKPPVARRLSPKKLHRRAPRRPLMYMRY